MTGFDANLQGADRGDRRLRARARRSPPTRARSRSTRRPAARWPTSACARRSARRSTTTRSSRRSRPARPCTARSRRWTPATRTSSDVAPYDPEAAKALLAEAGVEDLTLELTIPSFYSTTIPQILVSDLNEVGITLEVNSVDFPTWLNDVYINKDYDLSFVLHTEARDFENWANPDYYFTYDNPEVQACTPQSLAATDEAEAADLLAQAARIVSEDAAADWLYNGASVVAVGTNITGMPVDQRERAPQPRRARQEQRVIRYTLTRLALLLLGLLVASVLIFLTLRVLPGDIAQLIAGTNSTPEQVEAIRERLGLNQPLAGPVPGVDRRRLPRRPRARRCSPGRA